MLMRYFIASIFLFFSLPAAAACTLYWDYGDSSWLTGFKIYQGGIQTGTAPAAARNILCADAGLLPGNGPITATAYNADGESPHSAPATFNFVAPGTVTITFD